MYVQLLTRMQITGADGRPKKYQAGDFVDVGKQTARQWIAQGKARLMNYRMAGLLPGGAGVQPWGQSWDALVPTAMEGLQYAPMNPDPQLPFYRTLLIYGGQAIRHEIIASGLALLDTWQLAVPLWDYSQLANTFGSPEDREATEKIIHDLRVPVYDTRIIFARRCPESEALLSEWKRQREVGTGELTLSFLRALYIVKPLILPLPITWGTTDGSDGYA